MALPIGTPGINPHVPDPRESLLPFWMQKVMGGADSFFRSLGGPANPALAQNEEQMAANRQRMAMAAALLQASAPRPVGTGSFGADFGNAIMAGTQARDQFTADALRTKIMQAQLAQLQQPATPESPFAKINPGDFTPESLAEFQRTQNFSVLRRAEAEEPTGLEAKLATVRKALGRELTEAEILGAAGVPGGDASRIESQQIPPTQLDSVRLPDGSSPPIGMTWGEAKAAGAKVYSATDLKRKESIESALHTLNELEQKAIGENGVFVDNGGSPLTNNVLARLANGITNGLGVMMGTEDAELRRDFTEMSRGVIGPLIRSLGESGALSDGDVQRALNLLPELGAAPMTERAARRRFAELRTLLDRGAENLESGTPGAEFDFDPATSRLVPRQ